MLNTALKSAVVATGVLLSTAAYACPEGRVLTITVPYPPGTTDAIARKILKELGYPRAIVENKSGADGAIGADAVLHAQPDGCSGLVASSGTIVGYPAMHRSSKYQPSDFTALGEIGEYTMLLYVNSRKLPGVRTVADLATFVREHPGKINWGRPTSTSRIALAQFAWLTAKAKESDGAIVGVPFRGEAPAMQALIAGDIDVVVATSAVGYQHVLAGEILALATTGSMRSGSYPDIPTMQEAGIAGWSPAELTAGFYGPKGMDAKDVREFSARLKSVLERPDIREYLAKMGFDTRYRSPEAHAAGIRRQVDTWRRVIEYSGITQED